MLYSQQRPKRYRELHWRGVPNQRLPRISRPIPIVGVSNRALSTMAAINAQQAPLSANLEDERHRQLGGVHTGNRLREIDRRFIVKQLDGSAKRSSPWYGRRQERVRLVREGAPVFHLRSHATDADSASEDDVHLEEAPTAGRSHPHEGGPSQSSLPASQTPNVQPFAPLHQDTGSTIYSGHDAGIEMRSKRRAGLRRILRCCHGSDASSSTRSSLDVRVSHLADDNPFLGTPLRLPAGVSKAATNRAATPQVRVLPPENQLDYQSPRFSMHSYRSASLRRSISGRNIARRRGDGRVGLDVADLSRKLEVLEERTEGSYVPSPSKSMSMTPQPSDIPGPLLQGTRSEHRRQSSTTTGSTAPFDKLDRRNPHYDRLMEERLQKHGFVDESISEAETQHDRTSSRSWETMDDVMETMDQPFSTGTPAHASLVHSEQSSGEPRGRWSTAVQLSLVEDEVPDSSGDGPSSRRQSSQPQHGHAGVIREYSAGDGVPDGLGSHPNSEQHPVDWSGTASIWRRRRWFQDDLTKSSTATTDDGGAVSRPIRGLVASAVDVPQEYGVARDAIPSGVSSPSPPIEAPPAPAMQMSETRTLHEHEDDWDETRPVRSWKRQGVIFDRVAPGSANGRIIWAQAFSIKGDREREQMLQRRWEMGWT